MWNELLSTSLFENLCFIWATTVNPLANLLSKNCVLLFVFLGRALFLLACEVRLDVGLAPPRKESVGPKQVTFSETQFHICKIGNDNIEFTELFRALKYKYKAFIIKSSSKDSLNIILSALMFTMLLLTFLTYYYIYGNLLCSGTLFNFCVVPQHLFIVPLQWISISD